MAFSNLRDELRCAICVTLYTDPVTLTCGHNFCRGCIDQVLNTQVRSRVYSCPECREVLEFRPTLKRNINLHNLTERIRTTHPNEEEVTGICCTYCIHALVPAVKSCLLCEASLCEKHLKVHSKEAEHVLTEPSTSLENRICSIHNKVLEYYCTEDAACICVSCSLMEEHNGHKIQSLEETLVKKKKEMRKVLKKMIKKKKKTEERLQSLEKLKRTARLKVNGEADQVSNLFTEIRRRVDDLEKKVMTEFSKQKDQKSLSDVIHNLEVKKEELSGKIRHIEELCNMTDPLIVLQDPATGALYDPEEGGDEDTGEHDTTHDVDGDVITGMLHEGFSDIKKHLQTILPAKPIKRRKRQHDNPSPPTNNQAVPVSGIQHGGDVSMEEVPAEEGIYGQGPVDILLDVNTANKNLLISDDLKTATWTEIEQDRPVTAERFQNCPQVMSSEGFSSGRHYWDVELSTHGVWKVGMCYPSMERRGGRSHIGHNNKSWCLWAGEVYSEDCLVIHNGKEEALPHAIFSNTVRMCLDYEAGKLSFYEVRDPIIPIHTFTATFTEPLHVALYIHAGSLKISGAQQM